MNLRRTFFGAVALAAMAVAAMPQGASAQIYNDYELLLVPRIYQPQTARGVIIPRSSFVELFSGVVDPDNGVAGPIPIGFDFDYNGQTYNQIYVSVNGWISFRNPLTTGSAGFFGDDPYALFNNTRPNLTVAPFFGDHYLRTPGFDDTDPTGRAYTPSFVRYVNRSGSLGQDTLIVEWENMNINYRFDPTDPDNPFANPANIQPQATSIGTFQLYLIEADTASTECVERQGSIEFHYGPVGNRGIVKVSGSSVGIEDEPSVPGGNTNFMNAVAWVQSGFNRDSLIFSRRLTSTYPPTGFPSQVFRFESTCRERAPGWGDGDADLTQLNRNVPTRIREDQRLFVTFADVIRILRHTATRNVDFDSIPGRHGFHGDVNHNGRFFYSTRNYNNTGDSIEPASGDIIRYKKFFPIKDINPELPFPNDNSFSGFLFDADEMDAALIMLYLAAKLPVLPWLPDTLPHFTGKVAPITRASDITIGEFRALGGRRVEIPVTFNGSLSGASGVSFDIANGARVIEVRTMPRSERAWVETVSGDNRVAIAAAGNFREDDVIAVIVVEADERGNVALGNVTWNNESKGARKLNIFGASTGTEEMLSIARSYPNPFKVNTATTLAYSVPVAGNVTVRIYNVLGHEVTTLVDSELGAGSYNAQWNGTDAAGMPVDAGVYYARIESNGVIRTVPLHGE